MSQSTLVWKPRRTTRSGSGAPGSSQQDPSHGAESEIDGGYLKMKGKEVGAVGESGGGNLRAATIGCLPLAAAVELPSSRPWEDDARASNRSTLSGFVILTPGCLFLRIKGAGSVIA